nr:hypothetical protein [Tanacetum cinerariifolium]
MLEREKLSGTNFNNWFRQLRTVLRVEKKLYVTEQPMTVALTAGASNNELEDRNALYNIHNEVACLMLSSMSLKLQRQFKNYATYDMLQELKSMFEKEDEVERVLPEKAAAPQVLAIQGGRIYKSNKKPQAAKGKVLKGLIGERKQKQGDIYLYMGNELKSMFEKQAKVERFDLIQTFHACKQEEGKSVAAYVLQMKGDVDQLQRLGYMLPQDILVDGTPYSNMHHSTFRSMFEREKLSENNFNDWFRQLKLVLRVEKKMYVIEQPLPMAPAADSATKLKSMFEKQAKVERFDLIQTFHACKQEEGKSVAAYVLQMKGDVDQLQPKDKGKANGKGKDKQGYIPKPKNPKPAAKEHPAKDDTCHHYKEVGH